MAKLEYNEGLVDDSLNLLKKAESQISGTGANVVSALSTIAGARGANYIDLSSMYGAGGLNESCIQLIEETVSGINARVEMIKEYNEDYENAGFFEHLFSTAGLLVTKFTEGVFGAGEQIVDGFASGLGFVAGIFSKDAKNAIGEFVKKDHVGDFYNDLYDGALSDVVKYSWAKEDGLAANIFKIAGMSAGYTGALALGGGIYGAATHVATAGASAATSASILQSSVTGAKVLMGSVKAAAAVAGIGGLGSGTQAAMLSGKTFDEALITGVKTAAIQAGTVIVVDWGIKQIGKAWSKFKSNKAAGAVDDLADDLGGAAGNNPTGNNPTGPNNTPGGAGGSGGASNTVKSADDFLNAAGKSADDMADDLINAVKRGEVSPEDAMNAFNKKASAATSKADKVQWHPDRFQAKVDEAAKAANAAREAAKGATQSADDFVNGAGKSQPGNTGGTNSQTGNPTGNNSTGTTNTPGGTGGASSAAKSADDFLNATGKSADEMVDDLIKAVERGEVSPEDAMKAFNHKTADAASKVEKAKWHPDRYQSRVEEAARKANGQTGTTGSTGNSTGTPGQIKKTPAEEIEEIAKKISQQRGKAAGDGVVEKVLNKADDVVKNPPTTPPNGAGTNNVIQLGSGNSPVDELVDAATDLGKAAPTATPSGTGTNNVIQLGPGNSPVDELVDAATDLGKAAPTNVQPNTPARTNVIDDIVNGTDDAIVNGTQPLANSSDDLARAMDDYQGLLDKRQQLVDKFDALGGGTTNAPQAEFDALKREIAEIDDVLLPNAGQRIQDLSSLQGTNNLPAVVNQNPNLPAVVDDVANLPAVVNQNPNLPAVVDDVANLPAVVNQNPNLPAVVDDVANLPAVVNQTPNLPAVIDDAANLPAVVNPTSNLPAVVEPAPLPAVVKPTPVPAVVPTTPTPVIPPPKVIVPVPPTPTPTPEPVPIDPAPVPIIPTTPDPTPTPGPTPTPTPTPGSGPGPGPGPSPTPTPSPDPTPTPTPIPAPIEEYAPIPQTGVAGTGKTILDYLVPGTLGVAGALGVKAIKDKVDENDDEDEEEEEF